MRSLLSESAQSAARKDTVRVATTIEGAATGTTDDSTEYPLGWAELPSGATSDSAAEEAREREAVAGTADGGKGSWWARVQARAEALGGQALDADGLAYSIPAFLQAAEVDQLVALGRSRNKVRHSTWCERNSVLWMCVDVTRPLRSAKRADSWNPETAQTILCVRR